MKEYSIFIRNGKGCPFRQEPYYTFEEAKQALLIMISDFDYRRKLYYIDNDFFNNKFPPMESGMYYQIQERNVEKWINVDENSKDAKNKTNDKKQNILNFCDYF